MTHTEINRIFWDLPSCLQEAMNLAIFWGHTHMAADTMRECAKTYRSITIEISDARVWAHYRRVLRQGKLP